MIFNSPAQALETQKTRTAKHIKEETRPRQKSTKIRNGKFVERLGY